MSTALSLAGLTVRRGGRTVLEPLSADIRPGETIAVCGPNGAGKTSLIKGILGLVKAEGGARIGSREISGLTPVERAEAVAYLPQERALAWGMPALDIVALGGHRLGTAAAEAAARRCLGEVGMAGVEARGAFALSGGERARILLARFLMGAAGVLLADEPIAGLDPDAQLLTLDLLRRRADAGAAVLATLHDLTLAARWADRVLILHAGRVAGFGPPGEVLTPDLLRAVFRLEARWVETEDGPILDARRAY